MEGLQVRERERSFFVIGAANLWVVFRVSFRARDEVQVGDGRDEEHLQEAAEAGRRCVPVQRVRGFETRRGRRIRFGASCSGITIFLV